MRSTDKLPIRRTGVNAHSTSATKSIQERNSIGSNPPTAPPPKNPTRKRNQPMTRPYRSHWIRNQRLRSYGEIGTLPCGICRPPSRQAGSNRRRDQLEINDEAGCNGTDSMSDEGIRSRIGNWRDLLGFPRRDWDRLKSAIQFNAGAGWVWNSICCKLGRRICNFLPYYRSVSTFISLRCFLFFIFYFYNN